MGKDFFRRFRGLTQISFADLFLRKSAQSADASSYLCGTRLTGRGGDVAKE